MSFKLTSFALLFKGLSRVMDQLCLDALLTQSVALVILRLGAGSVSQLLLYRDRVIIHALF